MLNSSAKAIVISSVSGGGKTTVVNALLHRFPELKVAITATSRAPREGEVDGVHYHFLSSEQFEDLISQGGFLENALVHGNHYGVPLKQVEEALQTNTSIILNIDVQGMESVKEKLPGKYVTLFLLPPDEATWERRLRSRGTDSEEVITRRLIEGRKELEKAPDYNYQLVNGDLDRTVSDVIAILQKEGLVGD